MGLEIRNQSEFKPQKYVKFYISETCLILGGTVDVFRCGSDAIFFAFTTVR